MIYVDMDGVVADFDAGIDFAYRKPFSEVDQKAFWEKDLIDFDFFACLRPVREGLEMVSTFIAEDVPFCFMTSTGASNHPNHAIVVIQKMKWLQAHKLGQFPVAFCLNTPGKAAFAKPGSILIDDREKVCDAWYNAGGSPIVFKKDQAGNITEFILAEANSHGKSF